MGRKKKVVEKEEVSEEEVMMGGLAIIEEEKGEPAIVPLSSVDFAREDLNNLAMKVNEIINYLNKNAI